MKDFVTRISIIGPALALAALVCGVGCSTTPQNPRPVVESQNFVRTNWLSRQAEIKRVYLVEPRVDMVKLGYYCQKQVFTNEQLLATRQLEQLAQQDISGQGARVDIAVISATNSQEVQLMKWMFSPDGNRPERYGQTNFPSLQIKHEVTNLASMSGADAVLLLELVAKTTTTARLVREDTIFTFGAVGAVAGGCAGAATAQPNGVKAVGTLGLVTGAASAWMVTGLGDLDKERCYGFWKYTMLRAVLLDGKTGEILWAKTCSSEFTTNELDRLAKAVFHQPTE